MKYLIGLLIVLFSCTKINTPQITKIDDILEISGKKPIISAAPSAGYKCVMLDFDGQVVRNANWNNGTRFTLAPANLTQAQKDAVLSRVQGYYNPYNVTVTATESVYTGAGKANRIRIIVTPTSAWKPGVSGTAYIGSFNWGDGTPGFVFSDRLENIPNFIGEIIAHEAGHSIGLYHQTEWDENCLLVNSLRMGPIMGNSLYVANGYWYNGTTNQGCTVYQNDTIVLSTKLGLK